MIVCCKYSKSQDRLRIVPAESQRFLYQADYFGFSGPTALKGRIMAYQSERKTANEKQNGKPLQEEKRDPEFIASRIPNSQMMSMPVPPPSGTPNSVMREMMNPQISAAEDEADRLSAGIISGTPNSIRKEMGSRLGSDFSSVHFHTGPDSIQRNMMMGSRAYTRGNDIYFGKGGFEPRVAAHELVHTVQQGAARGSVGISVAPGTVQRWWPFGKKTSDYDEEQDSSDIADSLFRIQAGFTASDEREKAERDAQYAKTYAREMKRAGRANRGRIRNQEDEEQDMANARNAAQQSAQNLRVKRKEYVSNADKTKFNTKILAISKDTYKELIDRRLHAAEELCTFFNDLSLNSGESASKTAYRAANGEFGRNFKLYNQIIQKVEQAHVNDTAFQNWKNEMQPGDKKKSDFLTRANLILSSAASSKNTYLKTEEGIRDRERIDQNNKKLYKKIYNKKKTKLDRMAAVYGRNQAGANQPKPLPQQKNPVSSNNLITDESEMDDSSDDIILEGLPENSKAGIPESRKEKSENIISGGMKEKDDASESSDIGMKENNNNIISTSIKEEDEDEESVSSGALKQKVMEFISTHSEPEKIDEDDEPLIRTDTNHAIRRRGHVTNQLVGQYTAPDSTINDVKDKTGKTNFIGSYGKTIQNLNKLGVAIYDQNLLDSKNLYTSTINPSISGTVSGIGTVTSLAGTVTGAVDTIRNFRNVDAGGSRMDVVNSGLDTLASAGNTLANGLGLMSNTGGLPVIGDTLVNASKLGGANMIPGLNVATGGISLVTGAIEGIRGQKSINTIDDQISALNQINNRAPSKDQQKLMKIFKQGRRVSELHRTSGTVKAVGGAITMGTGIALLTGPLAPITAAVLGAVGAGVAIGNFVYGRQKKKEIRKEVTAEEMGFDSWENEIKRVQARFPREKLSDHEAKEIILKGHGYDAKTRTEAFKKINLDRAKTLLEIATSPGPLRLLAEKVIGALGVHRRNGRYASGAQQLIAEKLKG